MSKIGVDVTKAQLEHAVDVADNIPTVNGATASGQFFPIAIGEGAEASESYAVAIGNDAEASNQSAIAIGKGTEASGADAVAIGRGAVADDSYAYQIGNGTNSESNTLKFANGNIGMNTTIVNAQGKIPAASIEANKFNPKLVAGSGVNLTDNQDGTQTISATGGGGGGASIFVATYTESSSVYSCDKSFSAIKSAYDGGQVVQAVIDGLIYPLVSCDSSAVFFEGLKETTIVFLMHESDATITYGEASIPQADLVVEYTYSNGTVTTSTSYSDIEDAIDNGQTVIADVQGWKTNTHNYFALTVFNSGVIAYGITSGDLNAMLIHQSNGTITLGETDLSHIEEYEKFVTARPSTNIDENAAYYVPASNMFPDVSNYVTTAKPTVAVVNDNGTIKMLNLAVKTDNSSDSLAYDSDKKTARSKAYIVYTLVNGEWVAGTETTDRGWKAAMGWGDNSVAPDYSNMLYSNNGLKYNATTSYKPTYDTSLNVTDITGAIIDTSDSYLWDKYKYNGSSWDKIGTSDYEKLLKPINDRIALKADASALANYQPVNLSASNVTIATTDWVADTTYMGYGYKADISITGVTSSMVADVYFSGASALLGTLAPFCDTGSGIVTIYCSANDTAVTIDKVVVVQ